MFFREQPSAIKYYDSDTVEILASLSRLTTDEIIKLREVTNEFFGSHNIESGMNIPLAESDIKLFNEKPIVGKLLHQIKINRPGFRDIVNQL